jgi:flagellar assembly protein FliH
MQSSSRVIKSTVIDRNKLIAPPALETVMLKSLEGEYKDFSLEDVYEKITKEANDLKAQILRDAEITSRQITDKAARDAEMLKKSYSEDGFQQGYKKGYQEGYDHGVREANSNAMEIIKDADEYLKACQAAATRYIKETQEDIVTLSVEIAKKILNTELTVNTEAIFKMAQGILSKAVDRRQIILKVNPQDFNLIKNRRDELSIYVEDPNNLMIVADSSIGQGSLKAETSSGFIDGSIDNQLDIILNSLLEG